MYNYMLRLISIFLQNRDTPLHLASREGHYELVEILIKSGAVTTVVNKVSYLFSSFVTVLTT